MIELETERVERISACQYIVDEVSRVLAKKKGAQVIKAYVESENTFRVHNYVKL